MRIYQINVVCGNGSTGRIAADLSRLISSNNDSCRIAYGRGNAPSDIDSFKISNKADLYFHALMTRLTDGHGLYSRRKTNRLIKDIYAYEPDVIHLHNIHGYYVNYELLFRFLKEYGKPVVWTLHDCWAFTGHCAHYDAVGCDQWKTGCKNCSNLKTYPASWNGHHIKENYAGKKKSFCIAGKMIVITPSMWLYEQVRASFLKDYPCIVINNGIDMKQFLPKINHIKEELKIGNRKLLLGVAGIWTVNKGFNDFVRLRGMLSEEYVICLVGVSKRQKKSLPQGIIGILKVEGISKLAQYYSAADFYLNLTYEDTFPTTNIESLACGTPVITYRTGGSSESITPECGAVVSKGDLNAVVQCLQEGIKSRKDYEKACVERAKKFQKDECYRKYIRLYSELLGEK